MGTNVLLCKKKWFFLCLNKEKVNCLLRDPPVSETAWRGLLQDLLDMQQNVYTCLHAETCHQVGNHGDAESSYLSHSTEPLLHPPQRGFKLGSTLTRSLWSPCCVPAVWRTYAWQGSSCIAPRYIRNPSAPTSERNTHANSCYTSPRELSRWLKFYICVSRSARMSPSVCPSGAKATL